MIVPVECREGETSLKLKQPGKAGCGAAWLNFLKPHRPCGLEKEMQGAHVEEIM